MSKLPFGFEKPEDSPGFLLWQTTMLWQRKIKKTLEPYALSHAQVVIMAVLLWFEKNHYDITHTTIITWTKLDKMTVSQCIKKLVTQGLLTRAEHSLDTRAKNVGFTNAGKKLIESLIPIIETVDKEFFISIPQENQQSFMQTLNKLAAQS